MKRLIFAMLCTGVFSCYHSRSFSDELLSFDIKCTTAIIKQGAPSDDFAKIKGRRLACGDVVIISQHDNGRVLIQIAKKRSSSADTYGFAGEGITQKSDTGGLFLQVDHMYIPPTGATVNVDAKPGGACFFPQATQIKDATHGLCIANINPQKTLRTVYEFEFDVLKNTSKLMQIEPSKSSNFDRILQYTLMNQTLPEGKHPVWIYYLLDERTIKVTMPDLDLCVVTSDSSQSDLDILRNNVASPIARSSDDWSFAEEIWKAAFQKYMVSGSPKKC